MTFIIQFLLVSGFFSPEFLNFEIKSYCCHIESNVITLVELGRGVGYWPNPTI